MSPVLEWAEDDHIPGLDRDLVFVCGAREHTMHSVHDPASLRSVDGLGHFGSYARAVGPVEALERIAYLLEAQRAETYKVRAFRNAADVIRGIDPAELEKPVRGGPACPPCRAWATRRPAS